MGPWWWVGMVLGMKPMRGTVLVPHMCVPKPHTVAFLRVWERKRQTFTHRHLRLDDEALLQARIDLSRHSDSVLLLSGMRHLHVVRCTAETLCVLTSLWWKSSEEENGRNELQTWHSYRYPNSTLQFLRDDSEDLPPGWVAL